MSASVFVLIFLIAPGEAPAHPASWQDVSDLISERWDKWEQKKDAKDLVVSKSRNWWHQHLLYLICQEYGIHGLEFATREIACLGHEELVRAQEGLRQLSGLIEANRLLERPRRFETYSDVLGPRYAAAFKRAKAEAKIEQADSGFEAAVSFFTFLKSLQRMVDMAIQQDRSLLFVMPTFNDSGVSFDPGAE